jgi:hypothetical protein
MLGLFRKPQEVKTDEQIKKDRQAFLDDAVKRVANLKRFILSDKSGWGEFCDIINDYILQCKKRKAVTALDIADDKTINELRLLDHGIYIMRMIVSMPNQFINKIENMEQKAKEEEENA